MLSCLKLRRNDIHVTGLKMIAISERNMYIVTSSKKIPSIGN